MSSLRRRNLPFTFAIPATAQPSQGVEPNLLNRHGDAQAFLGQTADLQEAKVLLAELGA